MEGSISYLFQPKGLDEEGQPVEKLHLEATRLEVTDKNFENVEVPAEILGTKVTSNASGFTGMAIGFMRHINGCFHVVIQPEGMLKKTNKPIQRCDFDLRECSGPMIVEMSKAALKKSKDKNPSPTGDSLRDNLPPTRKPLLGQVRY